MNPNSSIPNARGISGEGWAAIAGALGSVVLLAKKLAGSRAAKPDYITRAEFYAEIFGIRERLNDIHLALLEKLDANHRELLAALERQGGRISAVEAGLARLDERTNKPR